MARAINTTTNAHNVYRTDNFDRLTADIRRQPALTTEDEIELFKAYEAEEDEVVKQVIKNRIVSGNLRFVLSVAKQYTGEADLICDLVSLGTIGLGKAVEKFRLSEGFKFISFAVHYIRAEFSDYFRNEGNLVRRSNNAVIGNKDLKVTESLRQTLQREPSEDEIIEALASEYGIEVKNRLDIVRRGTAYLSDKLDEDGATAEEVGEIAVATASTNGYEEEMEAEERDDKVKRLLSCLPITQRDIMARAFGVGYDRAYEDAEIGEALGFTSERIRQLKLDGLKRMKSYAKAIGIAM